VGRARGRLRLAGNLTGPSACQAQRLVHGNDLFARTSTMRDAFTLPGWLSRTFARGTLRERLRWTGVWRGRRS
jgi:hypothetical protein